MKQILIKRIITIAGLLALLTLMIVGTAHATDYFDKIVLKLPSSEQFTIRVSLWKDGQLQSGDIVNGAINAAAANYTGYQTEIGSQETDGEGMLVLNPATFPDLPEVTTTNMFLMVQTKKSSDPPDAYTVYHDPAFAGTLLVRYPLILTQESLVSLIYRQSGNIGKLLVLDPDNSAGPDESISLQFGGLLGAALRYDIAHLRFVFSQSLRIEGNLGIAGQGYIASDHSAAESDGVLHLGRKDGLWEGLSWDSLTHRFQLTDPLTVSGSIAASSVILRDYKNCNALGTDAEGRLVCKGRRK